ncbi:DUF2188 domain-containing protein [Bacillus thermotolerans]|uniref:DUF2188 domain-containing protein n=1 Tax=Bacillus thermotolerans TaxID=1221996 RepID=A0A0F5HPL6_BACTR|nr:DUF2188 domain-containing protein [Bacillus thermotolerans]KKB34990.1 hypothetical protein QY97_02047 [Bacillus thermotolerans]KKB40604.1 hypothetical protein QY96_02340 [Bacillus thermotolerans]KKB41940.1 hypothetical protein QY95_00448 [Bacillus thermotolerans]
MPWSENDYPASMKNLPEEVRNKAIEIANALLEEGYAEGRSIAIGIDRARDAVGEGQGSDKGRPVYHLKPKENGDGWQLVKEGSESSIAAGETKSEVSDRAKEHVQEQEGILVIHREDGSIQDRLYEN